MQNENTFPRKNNTPDLMVVDCLTTKSICVRQCVTGPDRFLIHKPGPDTLLGVSPIATELMF